MENLLKQNERIDDLEYKGLKIIQNINGFCFGMDAVLLSDFAKNIKKGAKVIDLGTGTGIIGLLLCEKTNLSKIIGIEIQEDVADMARRSIKLNNLEEKFEVLNEDIKNLKEKFEKESFDVVVTNPPYKKIGTGIINEEEKKLISRHEVTADLSEFIKTASLLLKNGGSFFMVHRPERRAEIINLLIETKLEPKVLKLVYPSVDKNPNLVLIKAVKGAKTFLTVEKPLIVYNERREYTDEILKIYNK